MYVHDDEPNFRNPDAELLLFGICYYYDVVAEIGECLVVQHLDLQYNELSAIPDTIGNLHNLSRLGLRYNKLTTVPASLSGCIKFEDFTVEGNSLTQLPVRIVYNINTCLPHGLLYGFRIVLYSWTPDS